MVQDSAVALVKLSQAVSFDELLITKLNIRT